MPIDVTLVIDLNNRVRTAWSSSLSAEQAAGDVRRTLTAMAAILRSDDRISLIASGTDVRQLVPMQAPADISVPDVEASGLSSTYDALAAALLRPAQPNRRHLIVAWTSPTDTISANDASALRAIARRADAVLHVVERDVEVRAGVTSW
jgi:sulfur relay (sulfurtransferase) DsrF/TusC family protein